MPQGDRLQFIILAEGKRDYDFARGYLLRRFGRQRADIRRASTVSAGRGSGEQQVRERFADELRALRAYAGENRFLVVMTDGDRLSAARRREQLEAQEARRDGDKAAIIVPCRNLESWFAWLDGEFENEDTDYKPRYRQAKPMRRGQSMADECGGADISAMPRSLREACSELKRIA